MKKFRLHPSSFLFIAIVALTPSSSLLAQAVVESASDVEVQTIDKAHTTIGFKIRHLFSKTEGRFNEFDGVIKLNEAAPEKSSVSVKIKADSIDTSNAKRDDHLKSADFFDVAKYPEINFVSKSVKRTGDKTADVFGEFSMHGVTKEIVLHVTFFGMGPDGMGNIRSGWEATALLKRSDYGLNWSKMVEGTALVGEEVEIHISVEGVAKTEVKY